jgi:hypothetical protein
MWRRGTGGGFTVAPSWVGRSGRIIGAMGEWSFALLSGDDCKRCEEERLLPLKESDPMSYLMRRMIVCPCCSSKRCARAVDHRNDCDQPWD